MLSGEFGASFFERALSWNSKGIYPYLERAVCYQGTCEYIPAKIHVDAFGGDQPPRAPSVDDLVKAIDEMCKSETIERWKDASGREWLFLRRWFGDNYFKNKTKPKAPRPPSLARAVSNAEWENGNCRKLFEKGRKVSETFGVEVLSKKEKVEVEEEAEGQEVKAVFSYYKLKIQPKIQDLPKHRLEIARAIKKFGVDRCLKAIDNREHDERFWKGGNGFAPNSTRGAAWFFGDLVRLERYINHKATPTKRDGKYQMADLQEKI